MMDHRFHRSLLGLVLPFWLATRAAVAAPTTDEETPRIQAVPREGPVQVDGVLDEAAWAAAEPAGDFIQGEPVEGVPAEVPTEVRVLYDEEAIYIGACMYDPEPETIARQLVRRDDWGNYDYFAVSLDPNRDRRTGYNFRVSAAGVQADSYLYDDVREDRSWDAVWESAVSRDDQGWIAEIRIPLSQLRFEPADTVQAWGVNFVRRRVASNEKTFFALESRRRHGRVSVFGELAGLMIRRGGRRFEVQPYALARARTAPVDGADPFAEAADGAANAGVDVRVGLGTAFSLDLTMNPDFGQVEVDPAVINLSAFETFYPEKRPFFVEDARIFDFSLSGGRNSLFYSRRIGRSPQADAPDDADYTDVPDQTTILGAAKLTGRTSGGLSVGLLAAATDQETGRAFDEQTGATETFIAEPRTHYTVFRVRQDMREGQSQVGGIVTGVFRDLPSTGEFDFLPSSAYSAGVDFEHTWDDREWALWGFLAGSLVQGDTAALVRLQHSSNHYFQRPDATRLAVDSAATSMVGAEWRLQFERRSGRHWTGAVWLAQRTPGFDVNDLGYFRGGERLDGGMRISYREITPGDVFRSYRISAFTFHNWRHEALDDPFSWRSWDRAHKRGAFVVSTDLEFLNYWGVDLNVRYSPESLDDTATRGGPLMRDPASYQFSFRGRTDRRKALSLEPNLNWEDSGPAGSSLRAGLQLRLRPSPRLELELEPSYNLRSDAKQYVTATDDVGYAPTLGRRYLFADLERRTLSMETRLNVTFTPKLSLQLFAQPLLSSGDYTTYKQLAAAESFDFDRFQEGTVRETGAGEIACSGGQICPADGDQHLDYDGDGVAEFSFSDRDFNVRSLRGNAVLRWEYRPGSALYLVWQQNRYDRADVGDFDLGRDTDALVDEEPENVFILKADYWLGL